MSTAHLASMCEFVQDSMLSLNAIIICVVSTAAKGERLRTRRVLLHPWLCVIEAHIIDVEALFPSGALLPMEILLRMATYLVCVLVGTKYLDMFFQLPQPYTSSPWRKFLYIYI